VELACSLVDVTDTTGLISYDSGTLSNGQNVKYVATLSYDAGTASAPNCAYHGGTATLTLPDGTIVTSPTVPCVGPLPGNPAGDHCIIAHTSFTFNAPYTVSCTNAQGGLLVAKLSYTDSSDTGTLPEPS